MRARLPAALWSAPGSCGQQVCPGVLTGDPSSLTAATGCLQTHPFRTADPLLLATPQPKSQRASPSAHLAASSDRIKGRCGLPSKPSFSSCSGVNHAGGSLESQREAKGERGSQVRSAPSISDPNAVADSLKHFQYNL